MAHGVGAKWAKVASVCAAALKALAVGDGWHDLQGAETGVFVGPRWWWRQQRIE